MLKNTPENKKIFRFANAAVALAVFSYSIYWLYLCCSEHWLRSIGCQNLVLLLFVSLFSFISLFILTKGSTKSYIVTTFITFIPGLIVCFINRPSKYPDFSQLISAFSASNPSDPIVIAYRSIYIQTYQQYEYVVSRSCTSSMVLFVFQILWLLLIIRSLIIKSKKENEVLN